ncbi:hypothetical protein ACA910_022743 [Epithemia clementina (nom. ined.)]
MRTHVQKLSLLRPGLLLLLLLLWNDNGGGGGGVCVQAWTWTNSLAQQPLSTLLQQHALPIAQLKTFATEQLSSIGGSDMSQEPYSNEVFYLRYCLQYDNDLEAAKKCLQDNIAWRLSNEKGKAIATAALQAVALATADASQKWNNEPVLTAAPHSDQVRAFLTPQKCLTTTTTQGDLLYCIRAGQIDDVGLMDQVSIPELTEFFIYAKEVNFLTTLQRSMELNRLVSVITANDLNGVKLVGGSSDFRKALGASSKESDTLYPATNGPTLLLNLPIVLSALVKLFTPLFPESVKARLRFEQGPLKEITDLTEIVQPGTVQRQTFLQQIDQLVYK